MIGSKRSADVDFHHLFSSFVLVKCLLGDACKKGEKILEIRA